MFIMSASSPLFEMQESHVDLRVISAVPSFIRAHWRLAIFLPTVMICVPLFLVIAWLVGPRLVSEHSILFLNDVHFDPIYEAHSTATSLCHSPVTVPSFHFGRYGCDTPIDLLESFLQNAPRLVPSASAVVLGGDLMGGLYNPRPEYVMSVITTVTERVAAAFPGVPILPALGNAEFSPNYGMWSNDSLFYGNVLRVWAASSLGPNARRSPKLAITSGTSATRNWSF
jgi:hypothetical protein